MSTEDSNPVLVTDFELDPKSVTKSFEDLAKQIEKKGDDLNDILDDVFSGKTLDKFALKVLGVNAALDLVKKAGEGVKFIFDTIGEGAELIKKEEEIRSVANQFQILATRSGAFAPALRQGLEEASGGLIDTTELLKAADRALVDFSGSARGLVTVMEIAKKATAIFGGDVLSNFELLNKSIATGSTRGLKQLGIIIDQDKAYKDFARSIGTTAEFLTQAQKQQVILNEVLDKGKTAFEGLDGSTKEATNSFGKLKIAAGDAADAMSIAFSKTLKPVFSGISNDVATQLNYVSNSILKVFGNDTEKAGASIKNLEADLASMQKQLAQATLVGSANNVAFYTKAIENLNKELLLLKGTQNNVFGDFTDQAKKRSKSADDIPDALKKVILTPEEIAKRNAAYQQAFQSAQQSNLQMQLKAANDIQDLALKNAALDKLANGQKEIEEQQHQQKLQEIRNKYEQERVLTRAQYDALLNQENIRSNLAIEEIERASLDRRLANQKKNAELIRSTLLGGINSTIAGVGEALAKGTSGFDAFARGILGIVGDMAINLGQALIAQGLALEAFIQAINTLLPGSGAAAAALGVGLVLFGSALKARVGSWGSMGTVSGNIGDSGGVTSTPSDYTQVPADDVNVAKPGTTVNLTVNGNIIPRDRSFALELTELLQDGFDSQGTTLVGMTS